MQIIGLDALVFGVDDVATCGRYLVDYGLADAGGGRYEALDGTAVVLKPTGDATLPPPLGTASKLRETVYGVADAATLDAIEAELRRAWDAGGGPAQGRWLEGRSLSFGRNLSYWPFIEILKTCFDIGDDDAEDDSGEHDSDSGR